MPEAHADPLARSNDPLTSFGAARSMKAVAGHQGLRILKVLRRAWPDPLAAEQIADRLDTNHVKVNRRLSDLERLGQVTKTELRHLNRSGRHAFKFALKTAQEEMPL